MLSPEDQELAEQVKDIGECFGLAVFETLRCAIYNAQNPSEDSGEARHLRDIFILKQAWRNLFGKIVEYSYSNK